MYDAKLKENEKDDSLKYNCIYDRSYFLKVRNESLNNLKSGHIPKEDVIG